MTPRRAVVAPAVAVVATVVACLGVPAIGTPQDQKPQRVVGGKGLQYSGVQEGAYTGWADGSFVHPEQNVSYVRGEGRTIEIRPGVGGAVLDDIQSNTAVYTHTTNSDRDLIFFDITRRKSHNPPRGVNTKALESHGTLSGNLLMFWRVTFAHAWLDYGHAREQVVLFNLKTHKKRVLADGRTNRGRYAVPGQLNGDWAVWYECRRRSCGVRRMNLSSGHVATAHTKRPVDYAPSVTETGTAFFAASGYACGTRVQLFRWSRGSSPRLIYDEKRGIDTYSTRAFTSPDGSETVVFDQDDCKNGGDVYRLTFRGTRPSPTASASPSASSGGCDLPVCPTISPPARHDLS